MNSEKKLYEELVKYHPEFKNSQEDIKRVVSALLEMNPQIRIDQAFSDQLKDKLLAVAEYKQPKKSGISKLLMVLVPMFSFGFAVFGFWYFSDNNFSQQEISPYMQGGAAPAQFKMDMSDENQGDISPKMLKQAPNNDEPELEMMMMDTYMLDEIEDTFALQCEENQGEISRLENGDRVCTTKKTTCLEYDFENNNCNFQK